MKLAALTLIVWVALTGVSLHAVATPCKTEDSTLCYWNADTQGNRQGESFLALTETISIRTK